MCGRVKEVMKIVERYLMKSMLFASLLILAVLITVEMFVGVVTEMSYIGKGSYGFFQALQYVLCFLPLVIYQLFPTIFLLGSLLGLGRLAATSELVVMRGSGVSLIETLKVASLAVAILLVPVMLLGECVAPRLSDYATQLKNTATGKPEGSNPFHSVWLKNRNEMIHIYDVLSKNELAGITDYQFDQNRRLSRIDYAPFAHLDNGAWRLMEVIRTDFLKEGFKITHLKDQILSVKIKSTLIQLDMRDFDQVSLLSLYKSYRYREQMGLVATHLKLVFWQRIVQPLTAWVMICLGVPFVFGAMHRINIWGKLLMGGLIGFGFYTLNQLLSRLSLTVMLPPALAALLPTVIFATICVILVRRTA